MPAIFSHIAIIFNPESTGNAPTLAKKLAKDLKGRGYASRLEPTKRVGHAIEIAKRISLKHKRPLIISVSGDGGYNEVINGVMAAKRVSKKANPVVSVLGAGNANDHYRVMHDEPIIDLIAKNSVQLMDLISISVTAPRFSLERYAHSYIGFGITPEIGDELNRHSKDIFSEIVLVIKSFMKFKPFTISHEGVKRVCDSLLFANINEMAKFVSLDDKNTTYDNLFTMIEFGHRGKTSLLLTLLKAATLGLRNQPSYREYTFTILDELAVQCDGEIDTLQAGAKVTIKSRPHAIDSLH
ncbi:diacylglycerol kinase catalytic subunit [Candidatus Saccharibacteria bacterium RAAC3_TM7_1]|nr:diacylglycerol kinase catalytic subunit [Candidatus Saccharibacteria bacterium RAAC3_TM7_1]HCZ28533.1 diacylglycerol kinase [Candidatus Saccharibacteria bacterium]